MSKKNKNKNQVDYELVRKYASDHKLRIMMGDANKYISVWLTNQEKDDDKIKSVLADLYAMVDKQYTKVVVFYSGSESLCENTQKLISHNYSLEEKDVA